MSLCSGPQTLVKLRPLTSVLIHIPRPVRPSRFQRNPCHPQGKSNLFPGATAKTCFLHGPLQVFITMTGSAEDRVEKIREAGAIGAKGVEVPKRYRKRGRVLLFEDLYGPAHLGLAIWYPRPIRPRLPVNTSSIESSDPRPKIRITEAPPLFHVFRDFHSCWSPHIPGHHLHETRHSIVLDSFPQYPKRPLSASAVVISNVTPFPDEKVLSSLKTKPIVLALLQVSRNGDRASSGMCRSMQSFQAGLHSNAGLLKFLSATFVIALFLYPARPVDGRVYKPLFRYLFGQLHPTAPLHVSGQKMSRNCIQLG
ncbi:hypothetical protein GE21DRAFT_1916 [Neurospora crassa]|uniref:Uncharacterized protein n=1 Tax=Neurospora crassa (strain ATCC 24698 / 74-OR23-1A / CBS 708.71 / DSM 1257 / FGSC 987) TaxID=367110 RepID=A7UVX2_NEUCR|nr:hypothetical protein NCU10894 [Neurospora crassa OR74A]EDO65381.1 hypothetical protein NCU10894 [Neurospora crassa OR74A]KHE83732.1 hypothetical protein GE21DRAFT_1916 [Neurospora crassa]|eukprot:XP_001728472.1 hypothetical protein NCU10894 [Neurospora crassa OR74A]